MSNTADQLLYWVLQSVRGEDLPVKTVVDGTEYFVISNPLTKRIEKVKANLINDTSLWASYLCDFTNNTGVLDLGKLDESLTIKIDSVNDKIELIGLTEIEAAKIVNDLEVNGALSVDENLRLNSTNGSVNLDFTGDGDYNLQFQQKDGVVALLGDLPNLNDYALKTDLNNFLDKNEDESVTGRYTFFDSNNVAVGFNINALRVQSITASTAGEGAVNLNTIQAIGNDPSFVISDGVNKMILKQSPISSDINVTTPTESGQLALTSDITPPQNLDDVLIQGNTSVNSIDLTGTGDKINFSFTGIGESGVTFNDGVRSGSFKFVTEGVGLSASSSLKLNTNGVNSFVSGSTGNFSEVDFVTKQQFTAENNIIIQNDTPKVIFRDNQTPSFEMTLRAPELSQDQIIDLPEDTGTVLLKHQTPDWSGWAQYGDSQYTSASPLVITQGNTQVIDIDGLGNTVKSQLPVGVTDFYDTGLSKITPVNEGDGYNFSLEFKAQTTSNSGYATVFVDIGGSFVRLFPRAVLFPKGANNTEEFYFTSQFYTLNTFLANGGLIKIESNQGTTSIFDISLQIHKTHNAR